MALYIDKKELPEDMSYIPDAVLQYVLDEHRAQSGRLNTLHDAYMARNLPDKTEDTDAAIVFDYPRYIVDTITGMYLGDPVKYNSNENSGISGGTRATVRAGEVIRADAVQMPPVDISPIVDAYKRQSISDIDTEIGRDIGEYGEAYELEYASDDEIPIPKTAVCSPRSSVMVRDTSTEHHKLFFVTYEQRKRIDKTLYFAVFVYTPTEQIEYYSDGITNPLSFSEVGRTPHFFGEVPAVEYRNNSDRLGDFETVMSPINAYNKLMSDRVTDKSRFIDAVLAFYGFMLTDEQKEDLHKYKVLDNLPTRQEGADIAYIQKTLDENGVHILAEDLVKEIHKQSMTVDMTDVSFGTSSGQALKLKLLTMTMLVKNKIRSMERGLKKRFEMYNSWFSVQGVMPEIDKEDVDIVFSVQMPVDEAGVVNIVTALQGIVDDETLLSLLWFVKDPAQTIEKVKEQKRENQKEYFDTFGFTQKENGINGEDGATGRTGSDEGDAGDIKKDKANSANGSWLRPDNENRSGKDTRRRERNCTDNRETHN